MELAAPYESQAVVAAAIAGYRTFEEIELAHSNCLRMLEFVHEQGRRVFLQSCLIALRHRMSFGFPIPSSSAPTHAAAESVRTRSASSPPREPSVGIC